MPPSKGGDTNLCRPIAINFCCLEASEGRAQREDTSMISGSSIFRPTNGNNFQRQAMHHKADQITQFTTTKEITRSFSSEEGRQTKSGSILYAYSISRPGCGRRWSQIPLKMRPGKEPTILGNFTFPTWLFTEEREFRTSIWTIAGLSMSLLGPGASWNSIIVNKNPHKDASTVQFCWIPNCTSSEDARITTTSSETSTASTSPNYLNPTKHPVLFGRR
jgi:hypothetical protein